MVMKYNNNNTKEYSLNDTEIKRDVEMALMERRLVRMKERLMKNTLGCLSISIIMIIVSIMLCTWSYNRVMEFDKIVEKYQTQINIYNEAIRGFDSLNRCNSVILEQKTTIDSIEQRKLIAINHCYRVVKEQVIDIEDRNDVHKIFDERVEIPFINGDYADMIQAIHAMKETFSSEFNWDEIDKCLDDVNIIQDELGQAKLRYNKLVGSYNKIVSEHQQTFQELNFNPVEFETYQ